MQPFNMATLKVILIMMVVILINLSLPKFKNIILDMLFRSTVITICYGFLVIVTNSSAEVTKIFMQSLQRVRNKNF